MVDLEGNSKPIDQIQVGEMVLARNEFEPHGPLELKRVEELFKRTSPIIELKIGGQKIGTTEEHPFYVPAREAFVPALELQVGDQLISHDGRLLRIDAPHSTLQIATVYNPRVADYHTYFVDCDEWGWSVWAHNIGGGCGVTTTAAVELDASRKALIVQARNARSAIMAQDQDFSRNVMAARIQVKDASGKSTVFSENFISNPSATRPSYVKGSQNGMHSEDLLLVRLNELRTKGYNISRVDAFSERSACTRCALTDGGAIDQIRLVTGKNNFRMDYGVLDSRSQRELSTAITNIRSASLVDKSKVFLKQWWEDVGSKIN